jgi:hypothetical protein
MAFVNKLRLNRVGDSELHSITSSALANNVAGAVIAPCRRPIRFTLQKDLQVWHQPTARLWLMLDAHVRHRNEMQRATILNVNNCPRTG